jgi:hypothetical protein
MQSPSLNFTPRGLFIAGRWVEPLEGKGFYLDQSVEHGEARRYS